MNIRVISSLTDDDEDRFAPVLLKAMADLLKDMPITYSVHMETTRGKTLHGTGHAAVDVDGTRKHTSRNPAPARRQSASARRIDKHD